MKISTPIKRSVALLITLTIGGAACSIVLAQPDALPAADVNVPSVLIKQMAGIWDVQQRMWPRAGAKAVELPAAIARRRVLAGGFLDEVMESTTASAKDAFVRTAYFNYNPVSGQYEYFSLDSRAPQMMNERSAKLAADHVPTGPDGLSLDGGRFVAAQWGDERNVAFTYRLAVGAIEKDHQRVRLFLTPAQPAGAEFLAFEYVYARQR